MAHDVVIAGGGFGGLYAARRLERELARHSARIVLVTDANFMLYTPLLPGAAAGSLERPPRRRAAARGLEWTDIRLGRVTSGPGAQRAAPRHGRRSRRAPALRPADRGDRLGLARAPRAGLAEHALGFKGLADAIALRNRALMNLEVAESLPDAESRREYLTFMFVGAGYAGLEGIAELQDYVADVIDRYPRCRLEAARFLLVEAPGSRDARDRPALPRLRRGAALARHRDSHRHKADGDGRAQRHADHRRGDPHAPCAGRPACDHRRWCASWACRSTRTTSGSWSTPPCASGAENVWAIRRRRRRTGPGSGAARGPVPRRLSTPFARARWWPTTWPPSSAAAERAAFATARSACSSTWGGTRRSRRCSACACVASSPGSRPAPTTC